jgi:general secretion pathway protein G
VYNYNFKIKDYYTMKQKRNAFTLIELLVVIVIIALLSSLVAPKLFSKVDSAKVKTTKSQIQMLSTALDAFRLDVGRYPTSEEGLKILWAKSSDIEGWNGAYLPKPVKGDAWNKPYIYKVPGNDGNEYDLLSYGADGQVGGEDDKADISVWE